MFLPLDPLSTLPDALPKTKECVDFTPDNTCSVSKSCKSFPSYTPYTKEGVSLLRSFLEDETQQRLTALNSQKPFDFIDSLRGNIENFIGMTQVPTGVIGPLHIVGDGFSEGVFIPLATTEGALVASYHRGAKACTLSGGIHTLCISESVQRCPGFRFSNLRELVDFWEWVKTHQEEYPDIIRQTSRFAVLQELQPIIEGNQLILNMEFTTGDAAGQNMVTLCTQAICEYILTHCPIIPLRWYIESNYAGDKKASSVSFTSTRGKKISAECILNKQVVKEVLKSSPASMESYWKTSLLASLQSGTLGSQGHVANGLTALFLACGQDVACISEASVGITRIEETSEGDLYCSVTLPNVIVGTVGGGTSLPTQQDCLRMMGCQGPGKARRLAAICAALSLAGEVSIAAAIAEGHFTQAHKELGRPQS